MIDYGKQKQNYYSSITRSRLVAGFVLVYVAVVGLLGWLLW